MCNLQLPIKQELSMKRNPITIALAFLSLAGIGPAAAHVSLEVPGAAVGSTYKAVFRVPHGCEGKATTAIKVRIPEGFINVKPMPKAGWELQTVVSPYQASYELHGNPLTEGVTEVVWSGGELPDAYYDEFVFRGTVAATVPAGTTFYFPTVQLCDGAEEAWIDVTGAEDAEMPAPSLELGPAEATH